MSTPVPEPTRKYVATKHRDLHAVAEIADILEDLPEVDRRRVLRLINEKFYEEGEIVTANKDGRDAK